MQNENRSTYQADRLIFTEDAVFCKSSQQMIPCINVVLFLSKGKLFIVWNSAFSYLLKSSCPDLQNVFSFEGGIYFKAFRPSVHTNWRWPFSSNTHRFKNALESGSKRKRIHIVLLWTVENTSKRKRWPKISQLRAFGTCAKSATYVTTCNSIVFQQFSVDTRKHIKTTLVWTRIDRNRTLLKTH